MPKAADRGQADLVHGEAGDDLILGEVGDDVLFGDGQDDTIIGGTGNDRLYGGTGEDSILGDDGFFKTSRNGWTEPLWGVTTAYRTGVVATLCELCTVATTFPTGALFHEARLFAYRNTDVTGDGSPTSSGAARATTGSTAPRVTTRSPAPRRCRSTTATSRSRSSRPPGASTRPTR